MSQEGTQEGVAVEPDDEMTEESFLKNLYLFMKNRDTPIERIPHLGFKQIDLFVMFKTVQSLGGYNQVTAHQLWKQVYNKLGGNPRSTSAATCTRRHYEKLILPYECYLRGEDDKDLVPPRQQKRSRCHSFFHEDEESMRGGKRSYGHMHPTHQNTHSFLTDRVRIVPMPLNFRQYFQPGSALPTYLPVNPTVSPPHLNPNPHALYPPTPQELSESAEQQLVRLRGLANEYVSSSGWAEPLNLSRKEGGIGTVSQQPSSFTPPSSNKTPKFLNKVFPLYPACSITKEEGPEDESTSTKQSPAHSVVCSLPDQEKHIIDLTSSATSHRTSPVTEPTIKTDGFGQLHGRNHSSAAADTAAAKSLESKEGKKHPDPSEGPLNLSHNLMSPSKDSTGRMEIQIPLALLQGLFKGNFESGFCNSPGTMALQHGECPVGTGEARSRQQVDPEATPREDDPSDFSFRPRERGSSEGGHRGLERDRSMVASSFHNRYAINRHRHHQASPDIKAEEWEPWLDCKGSGRQHHPEEVPKSPTGSNHYRWMYVQGKDNEARRSVSMGRMQATYMRSHPDPSEQDQGNTGPLPLVYSPEASQRPQASMTGPPTVFMVNPHSPSLVSLTQEEYLKLRRLISSSP